VGEAAVEEASYLAVEGCRCDRMNQRRADVHNAIRMWTRAPSPVLNRYWGVMVGRKGSNSAVRAYR
jgi:hypothetical protein